RIAERLVDRLGLLLRRRRREVRSSSLLTFAISDQRELADDECRAARVEQRAVELAGLVLEDPEARDLARKPDRILGRVAARNTQQDAHTGPDLATRRDAGAPGPLDDGPQSRSMTRAAYRSLCGRSERASL